MVNKKKSTLILLILLLLLFNVLTFYSILLTNQSKDTLTNLNLLPIEQEPQEFFIVTKVIDGDTIEIANGERVRLLCIDTPERDEEGYKPAKEFLEKLILNKKVRLMKDVSDRGKYGRLIRAAYLEDGTFVNELITRKGYAKAYWYRPDINFCPEIQTAEDYAKANDLGIWDKNEIMEDNKDDDSNSPPPQQQTSNGSLIDGNNSEPSGEANSTYDCSENLYNCADFSDYNEAVEVFEFCGGTNNDVHHLDGDYDGIPCEVFLD